MNVAVICELNPAHNGHEYLVQEIRKHFGLETTIICLLSSNYLQRGIPANYLEYERAKMALKIGFDLVLEIPFPFSCVNAKDYANSAVKIAKEINCIDYLCFGSESGSIEELVKINNALDSEQFQSYFEQKRKDNKTLSLPMIREEYIKEVLGEESKDTIKNPNNILGIEYIHALKDTNIKPFTIKRIGDYHDTSLNNDICSASAIREALSKNIPIEQFVNDSNLNLILNEYHIQNQLFLTLLHLKKEYKKTYELDLSLYNRIMSSLKISKSYDELVTNVCNKNYSYSHINRAIISLIFDYTMEDIAVGPLFTRLLGANQKGKGLLKTINKHSKFPIITKNADYKQFPESIQKQFLLHMYSIQIYRDLCSMDLTDKDLYSFLPVLD